MKRHYLVFSFVVLVGMLFGFMLIPQKNELSLLYLKDKDYAAALKSYKKELSEGNLSVSVVIPMVHLYLQYGDVNSAVEAMERFVDKNPNNADALRKLGILYQYAQRPNDYLHNLEKLNHIVPSEQTLRELSALYNFTAKYDGQIAVLQTLANSYPASPKYLIDLANLQASQRLIHNASDTLRLLKKRYPDVFSGDITELFINLLLDEGNPSEAFENASSWLSNHKDPYTATRYASLLHFKSQPAFALQLLLPFSDVAAGHPNLLSEFSQLLIVNGREEEAFTRLKGLYERRLLPEKLYETFIELALSKKKYILAINAARQADFTKFPGWLLSGIIDAAMVMEDFDFVKKMIRKTGEDFLKSRPLYAAEIFMTLGDYETAKRWIDRAERVHDLGITEKFILANLCIRTGRSSDALKLLEHLVKVNNPPEWVFSNLAGLYIELDRADEGLSLFRWLRTQHQNSRITEGWAILSASAGREDEVISWFDCREEQRITDRLIRDLYYIANDKNKSALALVCAECLYRRHKGIEERFLLGNALLTAGRPYEALQYLRDSYLEGYDKESAYYNALYESFIEGKPVAGEIEDFILTKLSKAGLKDKQTEEFVYILLDINAYETALPFLKKLARKDIRQWLPAYIEAAIKSGRENDLVYFLQKELERNDLTLKEKEGHLYALIDMKSDADITPYLKIFAYEIGKDWMSLYEETLLQMGRRDELLDLWKTQAMKPDISTEKKRSIAFRMLDADFKKSAENVFFELAHESPPDDQDVAGLLFLCGPTPDKSIIAWLEARARSSSGVERAKWVNHLLNVNAVPLAIDIMEADFQQTRQTPLLFDTYLNALVMSGRVNTLSRVIIKETDLEGNPGRLQNFAKLAFQENQLTAATRAYKKLLTLTPDNHEAIKRLGLISFFNGKPSEAESYLSRYISADKGDYEVYYYYGEVLLHKNDGKRAKRYYQLALEEVRKIEAKDLSTKKIQALLLYRNGKINESLTLFRNLLNDAPYDKNLINDFVYVLLEIGDYKEAEKILSAIN